MPVEMAGKAMVEAPRESATRREFVWQAARRGERSSVGEKTGPTVWMTQWAGRLPAVVATASPVGRPRP